MNNKSTPRTDVITRRLDSLLPAGGFAIRTPAVDRLIAHGRLVINTLVDHARLLERECSSNQADLLQERKWRDANCAEMHHLRARVVELARAEERAEQQAKANLELVRRVAELERELKEHEGYPGIAHDFEQTKTALKAMASYYDVSEDNIENGCEHGFKPASQCPNEDCELRNVVRLYESACGRKNMASRPAACPVDEEPCDGCAGVRDPCADAKPTGKAEA